MVDSNIILGVVLGRRSKPVFDAVSAVRPLLTSARARQEVVGVVSSIGDTNIIRGAAALLDTVSVVEEEHYAAHLDTAARTLRNAIPSRDGSMTDAHVLALAWIYDADIWSHDRDFAGTGWPSWSSVNLRTSLSTDGE